MRKFRSHLAMLVVVLLFLLAARQTWHARGEWRKGEQPGYLLPSSVIRVLALDHEGLVADYLFLKVLTFFGGRLEGEKPLTEEDWDYIVDSLQAVTDLDPYFTDPYIFAEGTLTWDARRYEDANRILEKAARHRPEQWRFPFYLGFNHFYFLKDLDRGATYLMEAARLPGSPAFLSTLAARLAYYGGRTKTAVLFLRGLIMETEHPGVKAVLEKRMEALDRAARLEAAVKEYRDRFGKDPANPGVLVETGLLAAVPEDPYGGSWVLLEGGRVFSTSRFADPGKTESETEQPKE